LSSEGIRRNSACVANLTRFFDWLPVCHAQVVVEGLARLFRQLEPDWAASFLLPDRRAVESVPIRGDVIDAHRHDVTASKLAVDREVEQGEIARSPFNLQFRPY